MIEMRNRLIDLLQDNSYLDVMNDEHWLLAAEQLLANGVIVVDTAAVSVENRPLISQCLGRPLDEIIELVQAKEDGHIIVPPCKVGDTVYVIAAKHPCYACLACSDFCHRDCHFDDNTKPVVKKATVDAICFLEGANEIHVEIEETKNSHSYSSTYCFNDFGKTVFLTKELAEKALAGRSGE